MIVNATGSCIGNLGSQPICEANGCLMEKSHYPGGLAGKPTGGLPAESDAGYVWLVRNPWDATYSQFIEYANNRSMIQDYRSNGVHADFWLHNWKKHTSFWRRKFEQGIRGDGPKVFLVRYEDALERPADVTQQMIFFLQDVRDPSVADVSGERLQNISADLSCESAGGKCRSGTSSQVGAHSRCWDDSWDELETMAAELGYHRNEERKMSITQPSGIFAQSPRTQKMVLSGHTRTSD
jgi:hypothetical protein